MPTVLSIVTLYTYAIHTLNFFFLALVYVLSIVLSIVTYREYMH